MTQVAHGYTDWGRQVAEADVVLTNNVGVNLTGTTTYGPFLAGNVAFLQVIEYAFGNGCTVTIEWASDSAFTNIYGRDTIGLSANDIANQVIPVRGPYVRFTVSAAPYPINNTFQVFAQSRPSNECTQFQGHNALISEVEQVIPGTTTITYDASQIRGGSAYWHFTWVDTTNGYVKLEAIGASGGVILLDSAGSGNETIGRKLYIPALHMRIRARNLDALPRTFNCSLLHHPFSI